MGERIKSLYKKLTSFGITSVLVFSSLAVAGPVFFANQANAWGPLSDSLTVGADITVLEADTEISTISSQAVADALWQNYNSAGTWAKNNIWNPILNSYLGAIPTNNNAWAIASNTTITASSTTGQLSTDLISWSSDVTTPITVGDQIFSQFYFKSGTPGVHNVEIVASITRPISESGVPAWLLAWLGVGPKVLTGSIEIEVEDTTPPYVEITSPVGDFFNTDVEVRGTVTDSNPRHYWLYITQDGLPIVNEVVLESDSFTDRLLEVLTDEGEYVVTLAARDSIGGGASTGNRSEDVVKTFTIDKTKPVIDYVVNPTTPTNGNVEVSFTCSDDLSGVEINTLNPVITAESNGTITSEGDCIDYAGNVADPVEVEITNIDKEAPIITLVGAEIVTIEAGDSYTEEGATWTDNVDGSGGVISIVGTVVTSVPGTYVILYSYTDTSGNTGTATRTVEVVAVEVEDEAEGEENDAPSTPLPSGDDDEEILGEQDGQETGESETDQDNNGDVAGTSDENKDAGFLGLAWYWWLAILIGLAGLWWLIAAWRRRNADE